MKGFKLFGYYIPETPKMSTGLKWLLGYSIFVAVFAIFAIKHWPSDPSRPTTCKVLSGYQLGGGYKTEGKFILILEDEKHRQFDITVTPTGYYQCLTWKKAKFDLRESEITHKHAPHEGLAILFVLSCLVAIFWWVIYLFETL